MTPSRLDEMARLVAAATPGPWRMGEPHAHDRYLSVDEYGIAWVGTACDRPDLPGYNFEARQRRGQGDAAFIAAARTWVPEALAELAALRAQVERYREALETYAQFDPKGEVAMVSGFLAREALNHE